MLSRGEGRERFFCVSASPYALPQRVYVVGINVMKGNAVYLWTFYTLFPHFVVERAFVAWTHDAQVFLARALEEGMNGESVMDIEATGLKWVPGRNGFVKRWWDRRDRGHEIARVSFKNPPSVLTTLLK